MTDTTERAKLLALADRHIAQIDYSVELQRIIEDLCHNRPIREPKSGAKHYYEMAVAYRLASQDQKPVAWLQSRGGVEILCKNRLDPGGFERCWTEKPLYLSPPPAAVEINASAEARLSEALEQIIRYCDESTDPVIALTAKKALSAHSPASDCDKQGCMGDASPCDPKDLQELLNSPSVLDATTKSEGGVKAGAPVVSPEVLNTAPATGQFVGERHPSDRTADVTVDELHAFILKRGDALLIVKAVNSHKAAFAALRESYAVLAFAFNRLHASPRSRDGELCDSFSKVRGRIEKTFKDAGEKL